MSTCGCCGQNSSFLRNQNNQRHDLHATSIQDDDPTVFLNGPDLTKPLCSAPSGQLAQA